MRAPTCDADRVPWASTQGQVLLAAATARVEPGAGGGIYVSSLALDSHWPAAQTALRSACCRSGVATAGIARAPLECAPWLSPRPTLPRTISRRPVVAAWKHA